MTAKRWVAVQVLYPEQVWETGRDDFRIRVSERGGRFLPDTTRGHETVIAVYVEHEGASAADAAMRAIAAIQNDGLEAGIGIPTGIGVETTDRPPSQYRRYSRPET